jgi:hypothetical protein
MVRDFDDFGSDLTTNTFGLPKFAGLNNFLDHAGDCRTGSGIDGQVATAADDMINALAEAPECAGGATVRLDLDRIATIGLTRILTPSATLPIRGGRFCHE